MILDDTEMYNAIIIEFKLSGSILENIKSEVGNLIQYRNDICKLLKIPQFDSEDLDRYKKEYIKNININKFKIKEFKNTQIELNNKIKQCKQEIKIIKLHMNILENKIVEERKQSKKYNAALRIFLKREKFKFIKKILFKSYRSVFLKYTDEASIKVKILQCNKRKEKIRQEKQYENNSIIKYKRRIIEDKVALAKMRKCIINMEKAIEVFQSKIHSLEEYSQIEEQFRINAENYKKIRHLKNK